MPPALNHCWIASAGEPATLCSVSNSTMPSKLGNQPKQDTDIVRALHTSIVCHDEPIESPILKCFVEQRVYMGWHIIELVISPA